MTTPKEDIPKVVKDLAKKYEQVTCQLVIDALVDSIVASCSDVASLERQKPIWIQKILDAAKVANVELIRDTPSWRQIKTIIQEREVTESSSSNNSAVPTLRSRSSSALKTRICEEDKAKFEEAFNTFDKRKFWVLKASIEDAKQKGVPEESVLSVEEKVKKLALESKFKHPSQSFILDLNDGNWDDEFTAAEFEELDSFGAPVLVPVVPEIAGILTEFEKLTNAHEAYNFARKLDHDPINEPLKAWLSMSIMQTAYLFLKKDGHNVAEYLETDKQYLLWGFLNTIFQGTSIWALGKEKSSVASAASANSKRKLSSTDEICRKAMGRKVDEVYIGGSIELGCMEIGGSSADQTKEMKDGHIKMPHVLKDMLLDIVKKSPALAHQAHVTGYLISGNQVCMMDVDSPKGYITRIRRTMPMLYPTSTEDYVVRMVPLLQLATIVMQRMENTRQLFMHTKIPLQMSNRRNTILPPNLPSMPSSSSSSETSSSTNTSESAQKRQKKSQ